MRFFVIPLITLVMLTSLCLAKSVELASAQIYKSQGDYLKAIEFYKQAVVELSGDLEKLKQEYTDEKKFKKKSKGTVKSLVTAYFEMGECFKLLGDYVKMSDNYNLSLDHGDKFYDDIYEDRERLWVDFFNAGVPFFNDKNYIEALKNFNMAVVVDPENIDTYKHRGMCFIQLAQGEEDPEAKAALKLKAIADFDIIIENDPEGREVSVRVNKANVYYQDRDYEKAEPAYDAVLAVEPDNIIAVSKLALIYQEQGRSEDAVAMYNKILTTKGDDPDLWFNLGILYFQIASELDSMLLISESQEDSVQILSRQKDYYQEAKNAFDRVIEINPDDDESIMNLVNTLWKADMKIKAIPYLVKALQIDPSNISAWQFLFVAYTEAEQMDKANIAFKMYKAYTNKDIEISKINPIVSQYDYESILPGMSMEDVVKLLGIIGTEVSSFYFSEEIVTKTYQWKNPDGSVLMVTFLNDLVQSKTQIGLN